MHVQVVTQAILLILGISQLEIATASDGISTRKIVYEMDLDNFIDDHMDTIKNVALDLDPLNLDDVNFPVTKHIYMYLHTGWAQNLAQLQRSGKCKMRYSDKKLNVDLNLGWDDLVFDYQYLIRLLLVDREGDLHGQMTKLNVHIALEVDFRNYHVTLRSLDLQEKGVINISLEGHFLDHIYNWIIKAVTRTFRTITLNTIKDKLRGMILHRIDELNFKLGSIINRRQFTFVDLTKSLKSNKDLTQFMNKIYEDKN